MYRTVPIGLVAFIIFASVSTGAQTPPRLLEARRNIRHCYNDVIVALRTGVKGKCKDKDDFNKLVENYSAIEKETINHTVSVNRQMIDLMMFAINQPYLADFTTNATCINMTSCTKKQIGEIVNLAATPVRTKKTNIIQMLFDPAEEPKYDERACFKARALKKCAQKEALSKCDNHTSEFFLELFDFSLRNCPEQPSPTTSQPQEPNRSAPELIPASFMAITITVMSLLR